MIKLLIFDIDGVLTKTKRLHELAFIAALGQYGYHITEEYHKRELDGLPTKVKLDMLQVSEQHKQKIFDMKQVKTFEAAEQHIIKNDDIREVFIECKKRGYKIAVASNAIKEFCLLVLKLMGIEEYTDILLSNEDVLENKPSPEIYNKIIKHFDYSPSETLIFEDSKFGLSSAYGSGANVFVVSDPKDIRIESIIKKINSIG